MSDVITAPWTLFGRLRCTYSDLVVDKLARHVHLLSWPSDGEDPGVVVGRGRWVPLQLHVSSRLLVDAFDGFSTCRHSTRGKSTTIPEAGVPTIFCNTGRGIKTLQSNQVRQVHQPVQSGPNKTSELMRNWWTNTCLTVAVYSHTQILTNSLTCTHTTTLSHTQTHRTEHQSHVTKIFVSCIMIWSTLCRLILL